MKNLNNDIILLNTVFNNNLIKTAGITDTIISVVRDYIAKTLKTKSKTDILAEILVPGFLTMAFGPIWTLLIEAFTVFFGIDLENIVKSIFNEIKSSVLSNSVLSTNMITSVVTSAMPQDSLKPLTSSISQKEIKLIKLALYQPNLVKQAGLFSTIAGWLGLKNIFIKLIVFFIGTVITGLGFMVAKDAFHSFIGTSETSSSFIPDKASIEVSKSYNNISHSGAWEEDYQNTDAGIEKMLLDFIKEVYGITGKDALIKSLPNFNLIKDKISWYNHELKNTPTVFLPGYWKTKEDVVLTIMHDFPKDQLQSIATDISKGFKAKLYVGDENIFSAHKNNNIKDEELFTVYDSEDK